MDSINYELNDIRGIIDFNSSHPENILGPKLLDKSAVIYFYTPLAVDSWIEVNDKKFSAEHILGGVYRCTVPAGFSGDYKICFSDKSGYISRGHDPYKFSAMITDDEITMFRNGNLLNAYKIFGSHVLTYPECRGVRFVVWAPNAISVSVIGNFNHWYHGSHPMINVRNSGIWELFIPDIFQGEIYKYAIKTRNGDVLEKTDPFAVHTEIRPKTGALVFDSEYRWNDEKWMRNRAFVDYNREKISIYEIHPGSWKRNSDGSFLSYTEMAQELCMHIRNLGFTHVEFMPLMEHPLDGSWGYQVINYFAPTSRFGNPDEFRYLVDLLHQNGIGVIMDWVPAHFPRDNYGLIQFDGSHLYEYEDPRKGHHPDWGTMIFDYGKGEVVNFLISNCLYWLDLFHIDGIRIDAVSSMLYLDYSRGPGNWVPNRYGGRENLEAIDFLRKLNSSVTKRFPGTMMIAEESTAWPGVTGDISSGGLGFQYKWNMGWMHDTLEFFSADPIYRKFNLNRITFSLWYAFSEKFILPLSHDEVVHGKGSLFSKMPGNSQSKLANLRLLISYMFSFPGKKLLFMGVESGQETEWNYESQIFNDMDTMKKRSMENLLKRLNAIYEEYDMGKTDFDRNSFQWIDFNDRENTVISFFRKNSDSKSVILYIFNFTPVARHGYRIGIPQKGKYRSIFNSDSMDYGGSGYEFKGEVFSDETSMHGYPWSMEITLPPLSCLAYKFINEEIK